MNSLNLAISVVTPLFLMMALGYGLKAIGVFQTDFLSQLNNLCFKVFLPMLLFVNVYQSNLTEIFKPRLVIWSLTSIILSFVILLLIIPLFVKDNRRISVMIQGIFRSNFILFGLPIASSIYGKEGVGITAVLIVFVIPLFNILAVIALEAYNGGKMDVKKIVKGVITNPLIIGSLLAFACCIWGIKIPNLMETTIYDISRIATPLSLMILGGSFQFSNIRPNIKPIAWAVLGKLVFLPLLWLPLAAWFGFNRVELIALLALYASPTAVSSFTMAQKMDADAPLAGQIVVVGSAMSIITIFIWVLVLRR